MGNQSIRKEGAVKLNKILDSFKPEMKARQCKTFTYLHLDERGHM